MKFSLCAAIVLPLGLMSTASWAADTCTGIDTLTTTASDETDLGQGLVKRTWTADSVVTSNDAKFPVLYGECSATVLMTPDGKSQMAGFCVRHDKDGDVASISINQAPGEDKRHHVATATTPMLKYRSESSTIPFLDSSREGGNGRAACHRCTKEQASRTGGNAAPT
jgi:hypothetical protein